MDNLMILYLHLTFILRIFAAKYHLMLKLKNGFNGERALVLPKIIVDMMEHDPLMSMLHITDIGYYPKAAHHYRERTTPIDQYVYIYCVDGNGWYRIGNHEYKVGTNQYFILPAGIPHAYGSDKDSAWTIYWIHFKGELAPYYAKDAFKPTDIKPGLHSRISNRIDMFEDMFNTLRSGYSNENLRYVSSLFHYYLGTLRYIKQYRDADNNQVEADNIVEIIIHFMKENIEKHITLQDISHYLGYSPSHFSMLFKKETGHSPLAYLNLLKIQQACQLLDTTDMKVNQICFKIGLEDAYYFSRLFSKTMGMSPKEYRELKKG
jgi:AraC family transcriptional regulator of arabinose operon